MDKVVIFVCMFVCPIITHYTPRLNFDWGTRVNHGNDLRFVLRFQVELVDFYNKK